MKQVELDPTFHLTRDELGIRPIYYVHDGKYLTYADHIAPLLRVHSDHQPDPISIQAYLGRGPHDSNDDTFFKGVKRLLAGQELICDSTGRVVTRQYWRPHFSKLVRSQIDTHVAAERTRELLLEAVESCIGDEREVIGVSLSGGLDSSSVVACVNKLRPNARIKTLSVISGENHEDAKYSEMVANEFGTEHIIVRPNSEEFWSELRDFVRCQEEPIEAMNTYCDWKMHERAHNEGLKKLLGGTGSDSLLLERDHLIDYSLTLLEQKEYMLLLANLLGFRDIILKLLWHIGPFLKDPERTAPLLSQTLTQVNRGDLLMGKLASNLNRHYPGSNSADLQCLYNNATYFGIEPKLPFFYMPLVEYHMTLPLDCKMHNGYTKYVLREAMKPLLPERVVRRRSKDIFAHPVSQWFNGPLREKLRDFFSSQSLRGTEYYNLSRVHELLAKKMQKPECMYLWRVLNLEIWLQEFF